MQVSFTELHDLQPQAQGSVAILLIVVRFARLIGLMFLSCALAGDRFTQSSTVVLMVVALVGPGLRLRFRPSTHQFEQQRPSLGPVALH